MPTIPLGSIIIPVLNEAGSIANQLHSLRHLLGPRWELIVVDGGSDDSTCEQAAPWCDQLIHSAPGRSVQMNAGAAVAHAELLVFLHADTQLPESFETQMQLFHESGNGWGRFDVALDGEHLLFPLIARLMNLRSRLTGIATGDQTFFMQRQFFARVGGFAPVPLMEDVDFSRRACRLQRPFCSHAQVTTSTRKWQKNGVLRTIVLMWWIRLAYFLGVSPETLHRWYYPNR